jgi:hypothetical protein
MPAGSSIVYLFSHISWLYTNRNMAFIPNMKYLWIYKSILVLMFLLLPFEPTAAEEPTYTGGPIPEAVKPISLPNPLAGITGNILPPGGTTESLVIIIIGRIIQAILGLLGVAGLAVLITGGVVLLTSGGNDDKIKKGKDIIAGAILGLLVVFGGYFLVELVLKALLI